ncbi:hypothetical protein Tco_0034382 [Tanacetum coccineum]
MSLHHLHLHDHVTTTASRHVPPLHLHLPPSVTPAVIITMSPLPFPRRPIATSPPPPSLHHRQSRHHHPRHPTAATTSSPPPRQPLRTTITFNPSCS